MLLAIAGRIERKAWPYVACGLLCVISTGGIVFGSGAWIVAAATVQGFAASAILILILALPPLLGAPDDVHRVTAAIFTISYSCAVIVPVISGLAWVSRVGKSPKFCICADRDLRHHPGHPGAGDQSRQTCQRMIPKSLPSDLIRGLATGFRIEIMRNSRR